MSQNDHRISLARFAWMAVAKMHLRTMPDRGEIAVYQGFPAAGGNASGGE
jgi:hypothetical protein